MQKILTLIGGIVVLGLLAFGVNYAISPHEGKALDDEAKAYVDTALPKILSTWDEVALLDALDPRTPEPMKQQMLMAFAGYKALGNLVRYDQSSGRGAVSGRKVRAMFVATATFANGPAGIAVTASKESGDWKLVSLNVASQVLMPAMPQGEAPAPESTIPNPHAQ